MVAGNTRRRSGGIVLTAGVERLVYFRLLSAIGSCRRSAPRGRDDLLAAQELYDDVFVPSAVWEEERGRTL
ncbi:hypothetical protein GCM10023147_43980 [Tsukamurella soli]|uniref:Uncharacterized protein n=1 Tax=Tsukamurella soli TaxID=644556 RepID=A0ABP8K9T2_9ACTN